ncbi:MAG: hypothetical protein V3T82_09250 [Nitrospinaceae bacterium]
MSLNNDIRNTQSIEDLVRLLADAFRTGMAFITAYEIETAFERMVLTEKEEATCDKCGDPIQCYPCTGEVLACGKCDNNMECPNCETATCRECESGLTCLECNPAPMKCGECNEEIECPDCTPETPPAQD